MTTKPCLRNIGTSTDHFAGYIAFGGPVQMIPHQDQRADEPWIPCRNFAATYRTAFWVGAGRSNIVAD